MRESIKPKRVINQNESTGESAGTIQIHTIVAIDEANDTCWNSVNEQFVLSEVETWAQVPSESFIFNQPIAPISATVIGADGKPFTDTLLPTHRPTVQITNEPIVNVEPIISSVAESKIESIVQPIANKSDQDLSNNEQLISALLSKMSKTEDITNRCITVTIVANIGIKKVLQAAELLDLDTTEVIAVMFKHGMIKHINIDQQNQA